MNLNSTILKGANLTSEKKNSVFNIRADLVRTYFKTYRDALSKKFSLLWHLALHHYAAKPLCGTQPHQLYVDDIPETPDSR